MSWVGQNFGAVVVGGASKYAFSSNGIASATVISGEDKPSLAPIAVAPDMSVRINGHVIRGKSISMSNGVLYVDGKRYDPNASAEDKATTPNDVGAYRELKIEITGNVSGSIHTTSGRVTVTGDSGPVSTTSGNVEVSKSVMGQVTSTSGNISVDGNVSGRVSSVSGNVREGGKKRKRE